MTFGNGRFVALGGGQADRSPYLITSEDGAIWTRQFSPFDGNQPRLGFGNGQFVAVHNLIWTSPDAISWTLRLGYSHYSGAGMYWMNAATWGDRFQAVGARGDVYASADGSQWTGNASASFFGLNGVAYSPTFDRYVAVGDSVIQYTTGDAPPTVSVNDMAVTEGNSGATTADVPVVLSYPSEQTITVDYFTANGTATASSDYTAVPGQTLTFSPGSWVQTAPVSVVGDTLTEADETFLVNLGSPVNATIGDGQGIVTIRDDEPRLSINDATVTEGDAGTVDAVFTVTCTGCTGTPVSVDYFTSAAWPAVAGVDLLLVSGAVILSAETPTQTIAVPVIGDTRTEGTETFSVFLSNASGGFIARGTGTGRILDNDAPPTLSIDDVSVPEGQSGTRTALFTVSLSGATSSAVSVAFATAPGSAGEGTDYVGASGTLTIDPSEGLIQKTIAVTINGDTAPEGDETFFVNLSNPVGASLADNQGLGTIVNDEGVPERSVSTTWRLAQEGMPIMSGAAANGSVYVLVGVGGEIWTSPNGSDGWTRRVNPDPLRRNLRSVTWDGPDGAKQFVAVGNCCGAGSGGLVLTSPNGVDWTLRPTPTTVRQLLAVTYGNGRWVAGGNGGRIATSTDAITWTNTTTGTGVNLRGVAFGGGQFVAVGDRRTVLTSVDGVNWMPRNAPSTVVSLLNAVAWTGSQFVVVAQDPTNATNSGAGILTSPDGVTWTQQTVPTIQPLLSVAVGGGTIVVVGSSESTAEHNSVLTSSDGVVWTPRSLTLPGPGVSPSMRAVTYGPSGFVSTGARSGVYTSPTGETWTSRTLPESRTFASVASDGSTYCAVGANGAVARSLDGATWTNVDTGLDPNRYWYWTSVIHANGQFMAVGLSSAVITSTDCLTWTQRYPADPLPIGPATSWLSDVTYGGGLYVAVGETYPAPGDVVPLILTSTDASTWTPRTPAAPPGRQSLTTVAYGNGRFVAFGYEAVTNTTFLSTSENGVNWTLEPSLMDPVWPENANKVIYAEGQFVVVGDRIRTSPDGIHWTTRLDPTADNGDYYFYGVGHGGGRFAAVGLRGAIYVSDDGATWTPQTPVTGHDLNAVAHGATLGRFVGVGASAMVYGDYPSWPLEVTLAGDGQGSVTSNPAGIDCGSTCSARFDPGTVVSLTASASPLSIFTGWGGVCSGTGPCVVTLDAARSVSATFQRLLPRVSINDVSVTEGHSGTVPAVFTVTLQDAGPDEVVVTFHTADGVATAPSDYVAASGTLTLSAAHPSEAVTALVNGDTLGESDEVFYLDLLSATGGSATIARPRGVARITDDDPLSLSIDDVQILEGQALGSEASDLSHQAIFTVSLPRPNPGPGVISVQWSTANGTATAGSDYLSGNGTLNISPGNQNATISRNVAGDVFVEPDETFFVNLSSPVGAQIADSQGVAHHPQRRHRPCRARLPRTAVWSGTSPSRACPPCTRLRMAAPPTPSTCWSVPVEWSTRPPTARPGPAGPCLRKSTGAGSTPFTGMVPCSWPWAKTAVTRPATGP